MIWPPLILVQTYRANGTKPEFPPLPSGMRSRIEEGSRVLSSGLLVGESLGVDVSVLSERLKEVWFAPLHRGKGVFMDEDFPLLIEGFGRIRKVLHEAIDAQGCPRGPLGKRLLTSSSIDQQSSGVLITRLRRIRLLDLIGWLDELLTFLAFARDHDLVVSEGELSRPELTEDEPAFIEDEDVNS
jgi:hypothetical protein